MCWYCTFCIGWIVGGCVTVVQLFLSVLYIVSGRPWSLHSPCTLNWLLETFRFFFWGGGDCLELGNITSLMVHVVAVLNHVRNAGTAVMAFDGIFLLKVLFKTEPSGKC